jgi:phenylpropionate dioxygenase-like ring-hydroxylating dioxygenase large terminal subunit
LTIAEDVVPHFPKPAEGSWTEHYPHLGTGPMSYDDSISPEWYERERRAIFATTWLNVGRVEQLPRAGSYFTKELAVADTSVVVVRGSDGDVRAFHNMCRHRGNKLVWQDDPREETAGSCRQFACKYHGWRYSLEGDCTFVQQEEEFFGIDKSEYGLIDIEVDVWEGFVFVNLDRYNTTSLRDYLGGLGRGLEGYPFGELTQVYKSRADVGANWKLYIDAFTEFYHAPVLHAKQAVSDESLKLQKYGYEALAYQLDGPHGMVSSWGGMSPPKDPSMVKPIERTLRSGLFGPWEDYLSGEPPVGINPSRSPVWGMDSFLFFPNFMVLTYWPNWVLTYNYWPTAYDRHVFEGTIYFVPPETVFERVQQELTAVTFKEYALQDCNTLEATQTMLESRVVREFPLGDQEIMLRHLHYWARECVESYEGRVVADNGREPRREPAPAGTARR